jgi:hypothetical protein
MFTSLSLYYVTAPYSTTIYLYNSVYCKLSNTEQIFISLITIIFSPILTTIEWGGRESGERGEKEREIESFAASD